MNVRQFAFGIPEFFITLLHTNTKKVVQQDDLNTIKTMLAKTPSPPYYAVIFSSTRTDGDNGYQEMSDKMTAVQTPAPNKCFDANPGLPDDTRISYPGLKK